MSFPAGHPRSTPRDYDPSHALPRETPCDLTQGAVSVKSCHGNKGTGSHYWSYKCYPLRASLKRTIFYEIYIEPRRFWCTPCKLLPVTFSQCHTI